MNFTAISETNELNVINALRGSIHGLLASYPTTVEMDESILKQYESAAQDAELGDVGDGGVDGDGDDGAGRGRGGGPILRGAVRLRLREKTILLSALESLAAHEMAVLNGSIPFQLALKAQERVEATERERVMREYVEEILRRSAVKPDLAVVEVDMGADVPKINLT
jgi:hypothetical protein